LVLFALFEVGFMYQSMLWSFRSFTIITFQSAWNPLVFFLKWRQNNFHKFEEEKSSEL
jgi:hypothetical protein